MKHLLFTYSHPDFAAEWDDLHADERQAWIDRHVDWFQRHGDTIVGGEELAWPHHRLVVQRRGDSVVATDGPFAETKEVLGGIIVVETDTIEEAAAMAAEWPPVVAGRGAVVVHATGSTTA